MGKFLPTNWRWNGTVVDFAYDQAWEFQDKPLGYRGTSWDFWTGEGPNSTATKMEQNAVDPRPQYSAFIQTAGDGYFGHYYLNDPKQILGNQTGSNLPSEIASNYFVYQGVKDITGQIELGGKGQYSSMCAASDAMHNCDKKCQNRDEPPRASLNDIDGFEVIHTTNNEIHAIIQEDSASKCGERMFLTGPLSHNGTEIDYYFVAMSGGQFNSRIKVGIPAGTASDKNHDHEFSGLFNLSGLLATNSSGNEFVLQERDTGYKKREEDAKVPMNDKLLSLTLQAHHLKDGVINELQLAEGGQLMLYKPQI